MPKRKYSINSKLQDCVVVSLINSCIYLNIKPPNRKYLTDLLCCKNGTAIGFEKHFDKYPVKMRKRDYLEDVLDCGIITIMHPKYNLHSVFCFTRDTKIYLVNSLLGNKKYTKNENVQSISYERLKSLMPRHKMHQKFYKVGHKW